MTEQENTKIYAKFQKIRDLAIRLNGLFSKNKQS